MAKIKTFEFEARNVRARRDENFFFEGTVEEAKTKQKYLLGNGYKRVSFRRVARREFEPEEEREAINA
jgi:hypothetical protein